MLKTWKAALPALALVAPLLLSGSPVAGASPGPAAKTAVVAYGDGPVFQDAWDQPVQLTFEAEEGDLVALTASEDLYCETIELTGPGGVVGQPASRFQVIPAAGTYTFDYEQICPWWGGADTAPHLAVGVQLLKGRIMPVHLRGGKVRLEADPGYVDIAKVVVGRRDGPVVLEANGGPGGRTRWDAVFEEDDLRGAQLPARPLDVEVWPEVGPDVILEPGGYVESIEHGLVRPGVPRYFYDLGLARTVRLHPLRVDRLEIDGHGTSVQRGETRRVRFRAKEGQWLRLPGSVLPRRLQLGRGAAPTNHPVPPAVFTYNDVAAVPLWRVPETGGYSLDIPNAESDRSRASYRIRLRSLPVRRRTLTMDDPLSTRLRPGRWVVHPVDPRADPRGVSSLEASGATRRGWSAVLLGDDDSSGYADRIGCVTDVGNATVDVDLAEWVVIAPGRRVGTLDLTLNPGGADDPREECGDRPLF